VVLDGGSSTGQGLTGTPSNDDNDDKRIHTIFIRASCRSTALSMGMGAHFEDGYCMSCAYG
jgi:hypothetical protein